MDEVDNVKRNEFVTTRDIQRIEVGHYTLKW